MRHHDSYLIKGLRNFPVFFIGRFVLPSGLLSSFLIFCQLILLCRGLRMSGEAQTDSGRRKVPQGTGIYRKVVMSGVARGRRAAVCSALPCLMKSFAEEPGQQEL